MDDFIDVRLGRGSLPHQPAPNSTGGNVSAQANTGQPLSRGARIRAFRAMQHASPEERKKLRREMSDEVFSSSSPPTDTWKAVHLLSAEEAKSLFQDVVEGLTFLASNACKSQYYG